LGCVLYELVSLRPPFMGKDMDKLYWKVCEGKYEQIPKKYSDDLVKMISCLLKVSPYERPSCASILEMKEFKEWESKVQVKAEQWKGFGVLLDQILVPWNLKELKAWLPSAQYEKWLSSPASPPMVTSDGGSILI
jgi:serine/threonine protein kinase